MFPKIDEIINNSEMENTKYESTYFFTAIHFWGRYKKSMTIST